MSEDLVVQNPINGQVQTVMDQEGHPSALSLGSASFMVKGFGVLTDPTAKFNSHFPYSNNSAYVTGEKVLLRGGQDQGWKTLLIADSTADTVQIGAAHCQSWFPYTDNSSYVSGAKVTLRGAQAQGYKPLLIADSTNGSVEIGPVDFQSWFPYTNNNSYISGEKVILRGGNPQGYKEGLTLDGATGNVEIAGDLGIGGSLSVNAANLRATGMPSIREAPKGAVMEAVSIDLNTGLFYHI